VTASLVPLPSREFGRIELAAGMLIAALRMVLQEIYGSPRPGKSEFIRSLPPEERRILLESVLSSPHYIPQLHHPVMRKYPFFDNVGLDLVLVDSYREGNPIPFRLLEINAGSPSGAANNMSLLEGLMNEDPELLDSAGRVLPNDHFSVLRETYRSLGESWTGRKDGIQVLIPPGGENGASPEIHELCAHSGLLYCDAGHLYRDRAGDIRMRSVQNRDPVVTAVYSRVNSDSLLFDRSKGILLRDPENGAPLYCLDTIVPWKDGKCPVLLRDFSGRPVPLESHYAIPGVIEAIHGRRLYVGGLNRLLDNKLILSLLSDFAPAFFRRELRSLGFDPEGPVLSPPRALPSKKASVRVLEENPEEWVVKAPNLSGGNGVHILQSLTKKERRAVLSQVKRDPGGFAYQRVVPIGRLPVAVASSDRSGFRWANVAADVRLWMFYGGREARPRLTRNALIRVAPEEKGGRSSIVNTSQGGGYAPFVIVDGEESTESVAARELARRPEPLAIDGAVPVFAAAQLLQVARILSVLESEIDSSFPELSRIHFLLHALSLQIREVAAYLHPRGQEGLHRLIRQLGQKIRMKEWLRFQGRAFELRARLVLLSPVIAERESTETVRGLKRLGILAPVNGVPGVDPRMSPVADSVWIRKVSRDSSKSPFFRNTVIPLLRGLLIGPPPGRRLNRMEVRKVKRHLSEFKSLCLGRWNGSPGLRWLSHEIEGGKRLGPPRYVESPAPGSALDLEERSGRPLPELGLVPDWVREARRCWLKNSSKGLRGLERERCRHFERFPVLRELQLLIDRKEGRSADTFLPLLEVLPWASNNLDRFASVHGVRIDECFTGELESGRIALLDRKERRKLPDPHSAGACFARKRIRHGRFTESETLIWVSLNQSPLCQAFTVGHEIHHAFQLQSLRNRERKAYEEGPGGVARFMNEYGNFLGLHSEPPVGGIENPIRMRTPLYGLPDLLLSGEGSGLSLEVREALEKGEAEYEALLSRYGGWFGNLMPVSPAVRVRALREVYPALENLKNLTFAAECGLRLPVDPLVAALPVATPSERDSVRELLESAASSAVPDPEALRIIASHQLPGVAFGPECIREGRISLEIDPVAIHPGSAYNQSQQQ
jgi:uncharacterized circularly permuted ATP-grasp superfamily protein